MVVSVVSARGRFVCTQRRGGKIIDEWDFDNGVTTEGRDLMLDVMFAGTAASATWYIGLIDTAPTLAGTDTHASHAGWTENVGYSDATRGEWTEGASSAGSMTNSSGVVFNINATTTIAGCFLANLSTKSSTSGSSQIWATGTFGAEKSLVSGDTLTITYTTSLA